MRSVSAREMRQPAARVIRQGKQQRRSRRVSSPRTLRRRPIQGGSGPAVLFFRKGRGSGAEHHIGHGGRQNHGVHGGENVPAAAEKFQVHISLPAQSSTEAGEEEWAGGPELAWGRAEDTREAACQDLAARAPLVGLLRLKFLHRYGFPAVWSRKLLHTDGDGLPVHTEINTPSVRECRRKCGRTGR